jgi:hypothetical protein
MADLLAEFGEPGVALLLELGIAHLGCRQKQQTMPQQTPMIQKCAHVVERINRFSECRRNMDVIKQYDTRHANGKVIPTFYRFWSHSFGSAAVGFPNSFEIIDFNSFKVFFRNITKFRVDPGGHMGCHNTSSLVILPISHDIDGRESSDTPKPT